MKTLRTILYWIGLPLRIVLFSFTWVLEAMLQRDDDTAELKQDFFGK